MARSRGGPPQANRGSGKFNDAIRILALSSAVLALPVSAARWEIMPTLQIDEYHTDNVRLAPPGSEESDWVTVVTPGITINATGPQLKFAFKYAPEGYYYAYSGDENNRVDHRLKAAGTIEFAKQLLFMDAGAAADQYNESLLNPLTDSNVNISDNRTTVASYFVSPYLLRDFGSTFRGEVRWTGSAVRAKGDVAGTDLDSDSSRADLKFTSGPAYKLFTWDLSYSHESIDYIDPGQLDSMLEVATAKARRLITPTVGILMMGGYESYDLGIAATESEGPKWSAGLDWAPSSRTYAAATAGRRFYGDAYTFDFRLRTRLTNWRATHTEEVTTSRSEFLVPPTGNTSAQLDALFQSRIPDPVARQRAVQDFIARTGLSSSLDSPVNFFSNQLFLDKKSQITGSIVGIRNTLMATVFRSNREVLVGNVVLPSSAGDFTSSNNIIQTGTNALWAWRVTARNTFSVDAAYSRNEFPGLDRVDYIKEGRVAITRQFQPRLTGSLTYRRQQQDTEEAGINSVLFRESTVSAYVLMRF
ncbi:MAG: TIGR03016 family PEP-CTERM system-associated outer membrane protein [Burkholderiales bacterium]